MSVIQNQRGSTLLVALIMLVLLTLIAVSAMSNTTTTIQVVGNAQFREEATAAGQRALKKVLSNWDFMDIPPLDQNIDINLDGVPEYVVSFNPPPKCLSTETAKYGQPGVPKICSGGPYCFWTLWDVTAKVTDAATGANVVIHQGVRTVAGLNDVANKCK